MQYVSPFPPLFLPGVAPSTSKVGGEVGSGLAMQQSRLGLNKGIIGGGHTVRLCEGSTVLEAGIGCVRRRGALFDGSAAVSREAGLPNTRVGDGRGLPRGSGADW